MTKKITVMLILLTLFCYGVFLLLPEKQVKATATESPTASPMPTALDALTVCRVMTGIPEGTVNLRSCAGTACPVLLVLSDGQALTIIQAGAWMEVLTADNLRGYINSKYCT
jgi:uncharacterized protein YraI